MVEKFSLLIFFLCFMQYIYASDTKFRNAPLSANPFDKEKFPTTVDINSIVSNNFFVIVANKDATAVTINKIFYNPQTTSYYLT